MSSPRLSAPVALPPGFLALLALPLLLLLAGCNSFESRSKEIRVGDTPDMVYIALGKPSEKTEKITSSGTSGTWIYSAYWQEYQGTRLVGYRREAVYNSATKSYQVFYTPDYQPIYTPRVEDRLRITFEGGRVTVVEQAQPDAKPQNSTVK